MPMPDETTDMTNMPDGTTDMTNMPDETMDITKPPVVMEATTEKPTNLQVIDITATSITLNWQAEGASYYIIHRGQEQVGTTETTSFVDSGLQRSTDYSYQVQGCINDVGCSAKSDSVMVTTEAISKPVLEMPVTSDISFTEVTFQWGLVPNADSYEVYRDGMRIGTTPINIREWTDRGLEVGVSYRYEVKACIRNVICSATSDSLVLTTNTLAKPVLTHMPTDIGFEQLTFRWEEVPGANEYILYRDGMRIEILGMNFREYTDSGLDIGATLQI